MRQRGLAADEACYGILVLGYCWVGKMRKAWLLLQEMIGGGYIPDCFVCMEFAKGYANIGRLLTCLNTLAQLRQLGATVSFDVYRYIISALCLERRPNAAKNLLKWMVEDACKPSVDIYNLIMQAFCSCGSLVDVFRLKDEMIEKDVRPNQETYNIMISFLCKMDGAQEGECMMEEMISSGLVPDSVTCAALVGGYCSKGEVAKAEYLLKYFALDFGIHDNRSFNTLMKVYCEDGLVEDAFGLQNRMMKIGFVPNTETCKSLIRGLSRSRSIGKLTHGEGHPERIRG
ncbi:hypothetical protein HPP92_024198 [Vanilla planifolia]|uniref:Pentatricopeptide repeat-containing protein n=1 Tax=Vanilla planifolia TaxID=51239 RepID=A0A835PLY4_VANPL|nr:hypothetical protein HPP92_024198 [Vanilla planifolia]